MEQRDGSRVDSRRNDRDKRPSCGGRQTFKAAAQKAFEAGYEAGSEDETLNVIGTASRFFEWWETEEG